MGKQFSELNQDHIDFIQQQKIMFVATAPDEGKINLSPKGTDCIRILGNNRAIWLNLTGSGNETAAHLLDTTRMTIMFCAFEGKPMILRLYGQAKTIHHNDKEWRDLYSQFPPSASARQIFDLKIEMVQTSCGMSVPFFDYQGERDELAQWAEKKGKEGIQQYWRDKNQLSLDGKATLITEKNL